MNTIAFHLPQYHPTPDNDRWWGKGFTEWTNVTKAKPLFEGHYQPHLPADLGFYDLRLPESRAAQAELAKQYGLDGFCYYHYWFNGRRILERPVADILKLGEPDFPFCLCWANENWTRKWDGLDQELLLEQMYSPEDDLAHIRSLLPVFADRRYIKVDGKPLFLVYRSARLPDASATMARWRQEAEKFGLPGLFLVRVESFADEQGDPRSQGFDVALEFQPFLRDPWSLQVNRRKWWHRKKLGTGERAFSDHLVIKYSDLAKRAMAMTPPDYPYVRSVCPGFDNTARKQTRGVIFTDSTPEVYEKWLSHVVAQSLEAEARNGKESSFVFINAWNEWAEGNHLEPCRRWGHAYLEATRRALAHPHLSTAEL